MTEHSKAYGELERVWYDAMDRVDRIRADYPDQPRDEFLSDLRAWLGDEAVENFVDNEE